MAFEDGSNGVEVASILRKLAFKLADEELEEGDRFPLIDTSGNKVGVAVIQLD